MMHNPGNMMSVEEESEMSRQPETLIRRESLC